MTVQKQRAKAWYVRDLHDLTACESEQEE